MNWVPWEDFIKSLEAERQRLQTEFNARDVSKNAIDLTQKIVQQCWTLAQDKTASFTEQAKAIDELLNLDDNAYPQIPKNGDQDANEEPTEPGDPEVDIPARADTEIDESLRDYLQTFETELTGVFSSFINTNFPRENSLISAAENWIRASLSGGTGISVTVENALWERDRSRIAAEEAAALDEATDLWAARGFPIPPGALVSATVQIQQKAQEEAAKSSREAAIYMHKTANDNARAALDAAVRLRQIAVSAAGDYMKEAVATYTIAADLSKVAIDAQSKLISAAASYYDARIHAFDAVEKYKLADKNLALENDRANLDAKVKLLGKRAELIAEMAKATAQQAAALFNNLHASVGISSSASRGLSGNIGYSYSGEVTEDVQPYTLTGQTPL